MKNFTLGPMSYNVPEPRRFFTKGDRLDFGGFDEVYVIDKNDEESYTYKIKCIAYNNGKYDRKELGTVEKEMIVKWTDICLFNTTSTKFYNRNSLNINFMQQNISSLISRYYFNGVNMNPDYQRDIAWTFEDKQKLLHSIFNEMDIGKFAFVCRKDYALEILDGKQRLTTIIEFYENKIPYVVDDKEVYWGDLHNLDRTLFENLSISVAEIKQAITPKQCYEYFLKLNTGKVVDQKHLDYVQSLYANAE